MRALFQSIRKTSDAPIASRKASRLLPSSRRIAAGDEIEHAVVAEALRALAIEPAPLHGEIPEQPDEEFRARQMNVGIGDRHRVGFDRDHDHMRVGLADVVLDGEPRARRASRSSQGPG